MNKSVKFSFRSRTGIDVAAVRSSAGATTRPPSDLSGALDEATQRALAAMRSALAPA